MCEFIKPENKDDINKIDKITEYVNVELGKCETDYKMTDKAEDKKNCLKDKLEPILKSSLLDRLVSLIKTVKAINKEPIPLESELSSVSKIGNEVGSLSSGTNENNTSEDEAVAQPPSKKKKFRKSRSPDFENFAQAIKKLCALLDKLNTRARRSKFPIDKRKGYALMGLKAVNETDIFSRITFIQEEYKKFQVDLASNPSTPLNTTDDPLNATPTNSPNLQNSNESTDILDSVNFAGLKSHVDMLVEK